MFKDNRPRLLTFHWSNCKVANMREGAPAASRPKLGRPKQSTSAQDHSWRPTEDPASLAPDVMDSSVSDRSTGGVGSEPDSSSLGSNSPQDVNNDPNDAQIQNAAGNLNRPTRSTRNPSPKYVFS